MPNWVRNELTIRGEKTSVKALLDKCRIGNAYFDFNGLVPMPTYIYADDLTAADMVRYGENNWYDWSCKNWGTKWNAMDVSVSYFGGDTALVEFNTAWDAPFPIFEAIKKQFPDIDLTVNYADEDLGRNCGRWVNGTRLEPTNPFEFACEVWGYDPDEIREEWGEDS